MDSNPSPHYYKYNVHVPLHKSKWCPTTCDAQLGSGQHIQRWDLPGGKRTGKFYVSANSGNS